MRERTVTTANGRFHCLLAGPEDGPAVVYLHGFPDHPPTSAELLAMLAGAGYRVMAPWLRGYAPSVMTGPFTVEQLVEDVLGLMRALIPGRRAHVLGHDWGAVIAHMAMARMPLAWASGVTLAVPHPLAFVGSLVRSPAQMARSWYMAWFQVPWLPERWARARDLGFIDALWRAWSPGFALPEDQRHALHACLRASLPAPIEYYRALVRPPAQARARLMAARGERITVPVLYLHGERDGCIGRECARGQERWFAGPLASELVAGVGHFLPQEAPDVVAERALAWYARFPVDDSGGD